MSVTNYRILSSLSAFASRGIISTFSGNNRDAAILALSRRWSRCHNFWKQMYADICISMKPRYYHALAGLLWATAFSCRKDIFMHTYQGLLHAYTCRAVANMAWWPTLGIDMFTHAALCHVPCLYMAYHVVMQSVLAQLLCSDILSQLSL